VVQARRSPFYISFASGSRKNCRTESRSITDESGVTWEKVERPAKCGRDDVQHGDR
jgi:hypothetical protein